MLETRARALCRCFFCFKLKVKEKSGLKHNVNSQMIVYDAYRLNGKTRTKV